MSRTYSIACNDCKRHIWIAQSSGGQRVLYSGDEKIMQKLKEFLFEHEGHNLTFGENCETDIADYTDVKW